MFRQHESCLVQFALAYTLDGHPVLLEPYPHPDGEFVLMGEIAERPTVVRNVDPAVGDPEMGIPAGAPRYRRHNCALGRGRADEIPPAPWNH